MSKLYANIGSGPDLKLSAGMIRWHNFDKFFQPKAVQEKYNFHIYDITDTPDNYSLEFGMVERFDFILVNHVFMMMNPSEIHTALINLHRMLKPGGELEIIDMDLGKVFESYQEERADDIPIAEGTLDARLCLAISGYGTRKSVFTIDYMRELIDKAGFRSSMYSASSQYDTRPKESLLFRAVK